MVQTIEGPQDVTDLLTDLSAKYEKVNNSQTQRHDLALRVRVKQCVLAFHPQTPLLTSALTLLTLQNMCCRFTRRLR